MNNSSLISIAVAFIVGVVSSNIYQKQFTPSRKVTQPVASCQQVTQENGQSKTDLKNEKTSIDPNMNPENSAKMIAEAKLCQSSLQDITIKAAELEVIVKGLVANQEERTKNWMNIKEEKLKNLALAKKDLPNLEVKLTKLSENFEKRLEAIKNGYLKKCPCSAN